MADYYTLQSGTGVIVLEDGSGNLLLQSDAGGGAAAPFKLGMRFTEAPFRKTITLFEAPNRTIFMPIPDTLFGQAWC